MPAYLALLGAGFHRQSTYRPALAAGLATNAVFGVVRTAIFFALYRQRDRVATGHSAGTAVAGQVAWVVALWCCCSGWPSPRGWP